MLAWLFHAPRRFLHEWRAIVRRQAELRRSYPNGGRCQLCGEQTQADERECSDCALAAPL